MKRFFAAILMLSWLLLGERQPLADSAAYPETFEYDDDVSKSLAELEKQHEGYRHRHDGERHRTVQNCYGKSQCIDFGKYSFIIPPYPIAEASWVLRDRPFPATFGGHGSQYAWVPVSDLPAAAAKLDQWRSDLNAQRLSDCLKGTCTVITLVNPTMGGDPVLGACLVPTIESITGAPVKCTPLLRRENGTDFIRVAVGSTTISHDIGRPDFNFSVRVGSAADTDLITSAISSALQAPPLNLQSRIGRTFITGIAPFRLSAVLPPLFDVVTVRIDFDIHARNEKIWLYEALVSTTIYVSQRNSNRLADWHLPSHAETMAYTKLINDRIKGELQSRCHTLQSLDNFTLNCNVSGDIGVETAPHNYVGFNYSANRRDWQ